MLHNVFTRVMILSWILSLLVPAWAKPKCPDRALGQTAEDCPWATIAGRWNGSKTLKADASGIHDQIAEDAKVPTLKQLWGKSINFDELAKSEIVKPEILRTLEELFFENSLPDESFTENQHRLAHAGLMHTYGYLFSNLRTQFGYKRARWVRGEIESAFDLPVGSMGPRTRKGTLLSNVTGFAGQVAFRDQPESLKRVHLLPLPVELRKLPIQDWQIETLDETVELGGEIPRKLTLRTDLVKFPREARNSKNAFLLVYSIQDSLEPHGKLVTVFPVESSFRETVMNPAELGEGKTIKTRYNAYVSGFTGKTLNGSRKRIH
jgi:hypothetical protein